MGCMGSQQEPGSARCHGVSRRSCKHALHEDYVCEERFELHLVCSVMSHKSNAV